MPEVTKETRIPSMLVWSSAVPVKAVPKSPPCILSKALAGKLFNDEHVSQAPKNTLPLEVSISGKMVNDEHLDHVNVKLVPLDVSTSGKMVNDEHLFHA